MHARPGIQTYNAERPASRSASVCVSGFIYFHKLERVSQSAALPCVSPSMPHVNERTYQRLGVQATASVSQECLAQLTWPRLAFLHLFTWAPTDSSELCNSILFSSSTHGKKTATLPTNILLSPLTVLFFRRRVFNLNLFSLLSRLPICHRQQTSHSSPPNMLCCSLLPCEFLTGRISTSVALMQDILYKRNPQGAIQTNGLQLSSCHRTLLTH